MYFNLKINLYKNLVGFLIKSGKKSKSKKIIDSAFFSVSKVTNRSLPFLLSNLFLKLNTFVEAKKVRVRRSSHIIPFSIGLKRRSYLITKWLMKAVNENKDKISITDKISSEILSIVKNSSSKAFSFKKVNNNLAVTNRSKMHFRW
jgi:ribosomal protein S7